MNKDGKFSLTVKCGFHCTYTNQKQLQNMIYNHLIFQFNSSCPSAIGPLSRLTIWTEPMTKRIRYSCSTDWPSWARWICCLGVCRITIALPSTSDLYDASEEWVDKFEQSRTHSPFRHQGTFWVSLLSTHSRVYFLQSFCTRCVMQ